MALAIATDAVPTMGALLKAVGQGDLTPTEAAELTKMVQAFTKIIETAELEERHARLPVPRRARSGIVRGSADLCKPGSAPLRYSRMALSAIRRQIVNS
jgi:hypothetical protein